MIVVAVFLLIGIVWALAEVFHETSGGRKYQQNPDGTMKFEDPNDEYAD